MHVRERRKKADLEIEGDADVERCLLLLAEEHGGAVEGPLHHLFHIKATRLLRLHSLEREKNVNEMR
jgi:hypothetical protein